MATPAPTERKGSTVKERQAYWERQQRNAIAAQRRQELWNALNHFIRTNNRGWIVSKPGDPSVRIECEPFSDLPDLLAERFDLQPLGSGTRIEGGKFLPVLIYGLNLAPTRK